MPPREFCSPKAGVVFQDYGQTVFSVADATVVKKVNNQEFRYQQIKSGILNNPQGVEFSQVVEASVERAICDRVYLTPGYYFDNLETVNKDKLFSLAEIYNNQRVYQEIKGLC